MCPFVFIDNVSIIEQICLWLNEISNFKLKKNNESVLISNYSGYLYSQYETFTVKVCSLITCVCLL